MALETKLVQEALMLLKTRMPDDQEAEQLARELENREELLAHLIVTEQALSSRGDATAALKLAVQRHYVPPSGRPAPPSPAASAPSPAAFADLHAATLRLLNAQADSHDDVLSFAAADQLYRGGSEAFPYAGERPTLRPPVPHPPGTGVSLTERLRALIGRR